MGWNRCRLSFAILCSAILCIRGSRSSRHHPVNELNIALAASEGRIPSAVQLVVTTLLLYTYYILFYFLLFLFVITLILYNNNFIYINYALFKKIKLIRIKNIFKDVGMPKPKKHANKVRWDPNLPHSDNPLGL